MTLSIVDEPGRSLESDALNTGTYAKALASFIMECDTPITVGVQGEWGSGKTTILGMIHEYIDSQVIDARGRGEGLRGYDAYRIIWINTWEHSILSNPENSLISILSEIADKIVACDGRAETDRKVKRFVGKLAKGALVASSRSFAGGIAAEAVGDLFGSQANPVQQLRETLESTIDSIIDKSRIKKFVIFIDDLDRLEPTNAVSVLELLKNIFSIKNCVFVVAIDYQVVVKGLKGKFGELTEDNEWEFRAFFDKIIQLPFMMPIGGYTIDRYLQQLLMNTSLFKTAEINRLPWLASVIKLTIGHNPRALKRMINSLSLINLHRKIQNTPYPSGWTESDEWKLKAMMLMLVCIQISYPRLYEILVMEPDFIHWNNDVVARLTKGAYLDEKNLSQALERAMETNEDEFDEEWEQALFKAIWTLKGNMSKLIEMSRIMTLLKDNIVNLEEDRPNRLVAALVWGIEQTAMTSVVATDDQLSVPAEAEEAIKRKEGYIGFWDTLRRTLAQSSSALFDIRPGTVSPSIKRSLPAFDFLRIGLFPRIGTFIRIEAKSDESQEELFGYFKMHVADIEQATGCKVTKIKTDRQWFTLGCPDDNLPKKGDIIDASMEQRARYCTVMAQTLAGLEPILQKLIENFMAKEQEEANEETVARTPDLQIQLDQDASGLSLKGEQTIP